jgi:hypothetical protein
MTLKPARVKLGTMIDSDDPAVIARQLAELRLEHRELDAAIDRMVQTGDSDELMVKRLKKRKLWLKDCIARLESALIPDEPA